MDSIEKPIATVRMIFGQQMDTRLTTTSMCMSRPKRIEETLENTRKRDRISLFNPFSSSFFSFAVVVW